MRPPAMLQQIDAMTPADLNRRITKSRRTCWAYRTFPSPLMGPPGDFLAMSRTEIGLLNGWAREHPDQADKILALVDQREELAVRVKAKAH